MEIHLWTAFGTSCSLEGEELDKATITHEFSQATCDACISWYHDPSAELYQIHLDKFAGKQRLKENVVSMTLVDFTNEQLMAELALRLKAKNIVKPKQQFPIGSRVRVKENHSFLNGKIGTVILHGSVQHLIRFVHYEYWTSIAHLFPLQEEFANVNEVLAGYKANCQSCNWYGTYVWNARGYAVEECKKHDQNVHGQD
jgi:hypothetical protein